MTGLLVEANRSYVCRCLPWYCPEMLTCLSLRSITIVEKSERMFLMRSLCAIFGLHQIGGLDLCTYLAKAIITEDVNQSSNYIQSIVSSGCVVQGHTNTIGPIGRACFALEGRSSPQQQARFAPHWRDGKPKCENLMLTCLKVETDLFSRLAAWGKDNLLG
jgi:hypothetical protein